MDYEDSFITSGRTVVVLFGVVFLGVDDFNGAVGNGTIFIDNLWSRCRTFLPTTNPSFLRLPRRFDVRLQGWKGSHAPYGYPMHQRLCRSAAWISRRLLDGRGGRDVWV